MGPFKKGDPPGGSPGGSAATRGWMRRASRTLDPRSTAFSTEARPGREPGWGPPQPAKMRRIKSCRSVAATPGADVVAEGVELTDPAAAGIVGGIGVAGRDRGADDGGAEQARADTKAAVEAIVKTMGFGGRGGGRDAAGQGRQQR